VSKRDGWKRIVRILAAIVVFIAVGKYALGQTSSSDEGKRKIRTRTSPVYPELARRMNVTGKVKIEVVIAPDGHIKSTRVIGGHPLLVQACQDAVKEWKFAPGPEETTQVVECDFNGAGN
jgi:TonB family protein